MKRVLWSSSAGSVLLPAAGDKETLEFIRREVESGCADLLHFNNDVRGYAVVRAVRNEAGKELVLVLGAGAGAAAFIKRMVSFATKKGFDSIRSHVRRAGLIRLYEKAGFLNVGRDNDGYQIMRRQDGRQKSTEQ